VKTKDLKKVPREANIELLRIVLMVMIILHHLVVHARGLKHLGDRGFLVTNQTIADGFLDSFLIMAVTCFIFISGYYGIKFKSLTIVSLLIQTFTYCILINIIYDYFFNYISIQTISSSLFPVLKGYWWFITAYVFLYMLTPMLNVVKQKLSKFQFLYILAVLTIINYIVCFAWDVPYYGVNSGYSVISFITIYFYGFLFKEYFKPFNQSYLYFVIYLLSCLMIFVMFIVGLSFFNTQLAYKIFSYNNPVVLISAISFFFMFKNIQIKSQLILKVSPLVLGVYLFHDHRRIRILLELLYKKVESFNYNSYLSLCILSLSIFFVAIIIEWSRSKSMNSFLKIVNSKFKLSDFDSKINGTNY